MSALRGATTPLPENLKHDHQTTCSGEHLKVPKKRYVALVAAAVLFISPGTQLAAAASSESSLLESLQAPGPQQLMMAGMTAKNFDPTRYQGRWFEVASLKRGFAGQGQEDCHCTQGVYRYDEGNRAIQVDTFCVHGSPDGYITGIRGKVQCVADTQALKSPKNDLEGAGANREKCFLRFPTLPFIPKLPYDVLATDYESYAIVSGAKDTGFVQIYSRTPNPGREFIDKWKAYLGGLGYNESQIRDTPQDCQDMSMNELMAMMASPGMEEMMNNTFNSQLLELRKPVQFNPFTSVFETLKQLLKLYFS